MYCSNETLLRRYLEAVAIWLPAAQREDIAAEFAEDLRSRIDDRETALGRGMNEDELVELLKQRGHPLVVAGSYSPQQYLIGPALFPIYRLIVKLVVLWIQLPLFAIIIGPLNASTSLRPIEAILQTAGNYVMAAVIAFAVITLVFAWVERYPGRTIRNWDPRRMPRLTIPRAILDTDPKRWIRGVSQAVCSVVLALGWQYMVQHWNSFAFGNVGRRLAPILEATYWPLMISLLAGIAQGIATFLFPQKTQLRAALRLTNALISLAVVAVLFEMRAIEQIAAPFIPPADFTGTNAYWIHVGLQLPLLILATAIVGDGVKELWRLKYSRPSQPKWTLKPAPGK